MRSILCLRRDQEYVLRKRFLRVFNSRFCCYFIILLTYSLWLVGVNVMSCASPLKHLFILIVRGFDTGPYHFLRILLYVLRLEMKVCWGMNPVGLVQILWTSFGCQSRIEVLQKCSIWTVGNQLELIRFGFF